MTSTIEIIEGAHIVDPANSIDREADLAMADGRIVDVGDNLHLRYPSARRIDARGCVLTPGLIDIHVHVMAGFGDFCLPPDMVGVESGVTTVVDAGTSSTALFGMARKGVIDNPATRTRVLALMDACKIYIATSDFICHKLHIANNLDNLDIGLAREVLAEHRDAIVGFKVRAVSLPDGDPAHSPFLDAAQELAEDMPVMVHFGGFPHTPVIPALTLLAQLRKGDIVTHAFRAGSGVLDTNNEPTQTYIDAYQRGVVMDVGHSSGDFHLRTARHLIKLGYRPTTISTDLNAFNFDGPVYNLTETMTKIWALGVPLSDVVAMVSTQAAATIKRGDTLGSLSPGREADISLLRIEDGEFLLDDGFEQMPCSQRLVAEGCWRGGEWIAAKHRGAARITEPFRYREAG